MGLDGGTKTQQAVLSIHIAPGDRGLQLDAAYEDILRLPEGG